ncbi:DnaB-like helicase N-terminal domain-containing protein, partial [Escherichia coli]
MAEMSVLCAYEAEQAVLGGLMLENERWDEVLSLIQ